jgi:acetyl esterase/lipase
VTAARWQAAAVAACALTVMASPAAWTQPLASEIVIWPEGVPNAQPGGGTEREEAGRAYNEGRTGAPVDRISARPDFVSLLYPVVTMRDPFAHIDSRRNLLGINPDAALIERMSMETRVRTDMPPVFMVHAAEDTSVPIENSFRLLEALRRHGVPVEAHFYDRGAHGFGMTTDLGTTSGWVGRWTDWMRAHGWL